MNNHASYIDCGQFASSVFDNRLNRLRVWDSIATYWFFNKHGMHIYMHVRFLEVSLRSLSAPLNGGKAIVALQVE